MPWRNGGDRAAVMLTALGARPILAPVADTSRHGALDAPQAPKLGDGAAKPPRPSGYVDELLREERSR